MDKTQFVIDKIAFEKTDSGYHFRATYLTEPKGEALIEISKNNKIVKDFLFPSYKIWNIEAHSSDIAEGLKEESERGLRLAGSDGLGGNVYPSNSREKE